METNSLYDQMMICPYCGKSVLEFTPSHFSFNKPQGACPTCKGIGVISTPDLEKLYNKTKSIRDYAIIGWDQAYIDRYGVAVEQAGDYYGFTISASDPIETYGEIQMDLLLYGKILVPMYFLPDAEIICPVCHGKRYQKQVLEALYKGYTISDILDMSVNEASVLFNDEESIVEKLTVLQDVGLGYLGLGQSSSTLSGGEAQRLKLARELSKHTNTNTLYLFDEPTTGLHPHDTDRLIRFFDRLVQKGNTVVVIEHNPSVIMTSDWVIEMGPRGGMQGGMVIAQGTPKQIIGEPDSITGKMLRNKYKGNEPVTSLMPVENVVNTVLKHYEDYYLNAAVNVLLITLAVMVDISAFHHHR